MTHTSKDLYLSIAKKKRNCKMTKQPSITLNKNKVIRAVKEKHHLTLREAREVVDAFIYKEVNDAISAIGAIHGRGL